MLSPEIERGRDRAYKEPLSPEVWEGYKGGRSPEGGIERWRMSCARLLILVGFFMARIVPMFI